MMAEDSDSPVAISATIQVADGEFHLDTQEILPRIEVNQLVPCWQTKDN